MPLFFSSQSVKLRAEVPCARCETNKHMLRVQVPPGYRTPFPSEWSPEQNALAIDVGVEAVRRSSWSDRSVDASKRELEGTLRALLSERKPLEDEVARLSSELRTERALRDAVHTTARADALSIAQQQSQSLEDRVRRAEEELARERDAQRQLVCLHESDARDRAAHHQSEVRRFALLVQQADERAKELESDLRAKQEALAQLSVAANKGNAIERELSVALRDIGLHPTDTSKGGFNTQYHDILVAAQPLHEVSDAASAVPRLEADESTPRCSLESKAHSRSGGLGAEREKFVRSGAVSWKGGERNALFSRQKRPFRASFVGTLSLCVYRAATASPDMLARTISARARCASSCSWF